MQLIKRDFGAGLPAPRPYPHFARPGERFRRAAYARIVDRLPSVFSVCRGVFGCAIRVPDRHPSQPPNGTMPMSNKFPFARRLSWAVSQVRVSPRRPCLGTSRNSGKFMRTTSASGLWPRQNRRCRSPQACTPRVSAPRADVGSFVRVLMGSGATGYLPASSIHEYAVPDHPGVICRFSGLNRFGGAVFDFREAGKR